MNRFKNRLCATIYFSYLLGLLFLPGSSLADESSSNDICLAYNQAFERNLLVTERDGLWTDPSTWGGQIPGLADNVMILHDVLLTEGQANEVIIRGSLELNGQLDAYASVLVCDAGQFIGTQGALNFHVRDDRQFVGNSRPGPVAGLPDFHPNDIGLWVLPGGIFNFEGEEVTSWLNAVSLEGQRTRSIGYGVSRTLAFDEEKAKLSEVPIGWKEGDQLLLVTEQGKSALATLTSITGTMVYYELLPEVKELNGYMLSIDAEDESRTINPKVANLTRRLKILSADVTEADPNHRAHTAYFENSKINISSVEFKNLGPRGKLGRYPIHWHHVNETEAILKGSSIWQSVDDGSNRFVTMHMISGAKVIDNVGFRSQGHGFFMEEKMEFNNEVIGNLSVDVRHTEELPNVDQRISEKTHHFWLRESNLISGNVAAGNQWDGRGRGNKGAMIGGLLILPSTKTDPAPLVTDFECLGCGGTGMWSAVPNTTFVNSASAYAIISGLSAYGVRGNSYNGSGAQLVNPLFVMNGNDELFVSTKSYKDKIPWVSQIYVNYGDITVKGGTLAGKIGIHTHYDSRVTTDETHFNTGTLIAPTYWESHIEINKGIVSTDRMFVRAYPQRRAAPGIVLMHDTCLNKPRCNSEKSLESFGFVGQAFASMYSALETKKVGHSTSISGVLPETGFLKVPQSKNIKYWSVTPVKALKAREKIQRIKESEKRWRESSKNYDGFPPGDYMVNLYEGQKKETLVDSMIVTVFPGEVTNL